MLEVRTGKRFPLELPIKIHDHESARNHAGTTANVSAAGVYVRAAKQLKVGSKITFDIMLPREALGTDHAVEIRCAGRVVRAETSGRAGNSKRAGSRDNVRGLACVIDRYRFVRK